VDHRLLGPSSRHFLRTRLAFAWPIVFTLLLERANREDDEQEPMEEFDKLKPSALFSGRGNFACKRAIIELNRASEEL
jgi:hypothetical protein